MIKEREKLQKDLREAKTFSTNWTFLCSWQGKSLRSEPNPWGFSTSTHSGSMMAIAHQIALTPTEKCDAHKTALVSLRLPQRYRSTEQHLCWAGKGRS